MNILFDIGNSSISWALSDNGEFADRGSFNYDISQLPKQLQQHIKLDPAITYSKLLVSNVADEDIIRQIKQWADLAGIEQVWQASVERQFDELKNAYPDISQMGVDRWLAMLAAWTQYKTALCVVDCGTALTIDVIDRNGQHLGGYILPGRELMQKTLITNTRRIQASVSNQLDTGYADNTQAAINHGASLATIATVNHVVEQAGKDLQCEPVCVISGGDSALLLDAFDHEFIHAPDLVLQGLILSHNAIS